MRGNKLLRSAIILTLTLGLCLTGLSTNSTAADDKVVWTFATNPGPAANSWSFHPYGRFQKLLERNSGGRFILKTKVGLYPPKEVIHAVMKGHAEMGWERSAWLGGTFPQWDVSLPFFWADYYEYEAFLNDPRMMEITKRTYADKGLVKISEIQCATTYGIYAKKPIKTLADFKGMKIRTAGVIPTLALQQMGASPLTMATTEILEALQRGTVDAVQTTLTWGMGFGLPDVATYVSIWPIQSVFGGMLIVNKEKFDALPDDLKKVLIDTGREMQSANAFGCEIEERAAEIGVKVSAMTLVKPDKSEIEKAQILCRPAVAKWLQLTGADGKEMLDIAADYASGAKIMLGKE